MSPEVLPTFMIRRASVADSTLLARHRCDMWLAMEDLRPEAYDEMHDQCVRYFVEALTEKTYLGWLIALESGEVVAGGGLLLRRIAPFPGPDRRTSPSENQAHILNMFTEPAYRNYGLAKKLMNAMLEWCKTEQVGSVTLNASAAGQPIYEKLGFTEVQKYMKWNPEKR